MTRITGAALGSLRGEVDASATMMRLTLEIVSDTLLGVRTDRDAEEIGRAIDDVQRYLESAIAGIALPLRVPTPQNRRVSRAIAALDRTADRLIAEKRRSPGDDVLTMLVEARDEDGAPLPDRQIRDELLTLLSAGHETTANALSWTLLLLAQHPAERRRLEEEVDRVLGGEVPTLDSLPKLQYTRFVIDEALRLYPPAWATGRVAMQPHVLEIEGGSPRGVQRGTVVILSPWVTHRRPDLWENAEAFDPERWRALSAPGAVHPFAFFPFGGGPRKCVGEAFAYLEATIVIAMIAQRMRLDLVPGQSIEPSPQITLGTKNGLRMRVVPR